MSERGAGSGRFTLAVASTLFIMYVVPFPVYGSLSAMGMVDLPDETEPVRFLVSVLVVKVGVALGFVMLLRLASGGAAGRWLPYAAIWWVMFAVVEIGQAIGPRYSIGDAVGGIVAEAIYFPLSGLVASKLLGYRRCESAS